jgi:hypothetical protein
VDAQSTQLPWLASAGSPVFPVAFALGFVWLSAALGRRILIALRATRAGTMAERGVIAVALGAGALQFVPFVLGIAGKFEVRSLRIATLLIVILAARDLWGVARAAVRGWRQLAPPPRWVIVWGLTLLPVLLISALLALVPTIDADGLGYHLTVPKRWFESGGLVYLPTYPYASAPMGVEMLFSLGLAFAGDAAAKCVHFSLGTLGVIALYLAGKRLRGPIVGAVAATLFLVGPAGVSNVLGSAYVEGAAAFAMIGAALAWLIWFQVDELPYLRCAALLSGIAVSFKITSALFPAALVALTYIAVAHKNVTIAKPARMRAAVSAAARLIPMALVPVVPWMVRAAIVTHNPFFPLFARWIPTRDFSPEDSAKFDKFNRYMTWGNTFGRSWTLEQRTWVLLAVCAAVILVGAIAMMRFPSPVARGTAGVAVVALLAQLSAAGLYVRYSIAIAAVLMLPVAAAIGSALSRRGVVSFWVALTLAASLWQGKHLLAGADIGPKELLRTAAGLDDRRGFLREHLPLFPLYEEVNRDLPSSAGVMLSCYCGGFYIDRKTFCAEMVQEALRFSSWDEFTADVRRLRITQVIAPNVLATGGPSPPIDGSNSSSITRENQYRMLRRLLTEHSHERATASDQGLYDVDRAFLGDP